MQHRALARYQTNTSLDEAALIQKHQQLIDRTARALCTRTGMWSYLDDLWNVGALGLIDAAKRFDKSKNIKFESFAEHRVKGAMLDELRRLDHLPRRLRVRANTVARAQAELRVELGREPDIEELCLRTGMDAESVDMILASTDPPLPLSQAAEQSVSAEAISQLDHADQLATLQRAITALPKRLQLVLALHYEEGLAYREIARVLGVSEPRVSQLHSQAVAKMRAFVEGEAA